MRVFHGRRVMVGALAVALTAIVAMPPAAGYAATHIASAAPSVASDLPAQSIWFKPALTGTVGDSVTLSAAADSQLPVTFASADLDRCKVDGTTLTFTKVGNCRVVASQAGDGINWGPAANVIAAIQVVRGYHAKATASRDGVVRTDGSIKVGDVLSISLTAADTAVTACTFWIMTAGGWLMQGDGAAHSDGSCRLMTVVPKPSDPVGRARLPERESLDLCVSVIKTVFADNAKRVMASSDRKTPGGFNCRGNNGAAGEDEVLDFAFDGTGSPARFSSSPKLLSWNIADWDRSYVPLQFNADWHVAFPAWVKACGGPYLNGEWVTVYLLKTNGPGCPDWSLRLPGMLPATMPWGGGPASWGVELVMEYTNEQGKPAKTISAQTVPYAPSQGDFRSSLPAISPTDGAKDRFVYVGDIWQPTFRISGMTGATDCNLHLHTPGPGQAADYSAPVDAATLTCAFDVPAFEKVGAYSQFSVSFTSPETDKRSSSFAAGIVAIEPPTQPTIPDPMTHANGTTTISVNPGAGQAMSIEMSVASGTSSSRRHAAAGAHRTNGRPHATTPIDPRISLCAAVAYTSAPPRPNDLPSVSTTCSLAPGDYVVTARKVDASGAVTMSYRAITVSQPTTVPPAITVPQSDPQPRED